jgi:flagellar export protein FliJ
MAYRFPLAAVLRLREIHEQREERLLTQILAQVTQAREAIVSLDRQIAEASARRETELLQRTPAAQLHAAYGMSALLKERKQFTADQLAQFEQLRDKQIKTYQAAHQAREVLSTMRQKQRDSFIAEQARHQQKALDDMFIARRLRR